MQKPPVGNSMVQKVQHAKLTYRDQKEIMKNIFGQGKMVPNKANNNMGVAVINN